MSPELVCAKKFAVGIGLLLIDRGSCSAAFAAGDVWNQQL